MTGRIALYFGYGDGGHFLRGLPGRRFATIDTSDVPGFPWTIGLLDSGLLNNGKVPDVPDGRVWWTCGGTDMATDTWHAFYWWDRSGDKRGASNSGFYVHGFAVEEQQQAFDFACATWPAVVARQQFPLTIARRPNRRAAVAQEAST